ncbi:hypothetical protein POM88_050255 [Heracleum sosnowskyi]|uniref:SWIM-type domain-containing protein n=1 Tax=Heracleum sosnowskyi TaxID=360622 RepID=A0AAD8GZE7_9APIA|nr:hypothetical protein POM88_050255 [Heracleum sosnowskyi]
MRKQIVMFFVQVSLVNFWRSSLELKLSTFGAYVRGDSSSLQPVSSGTNSNRITDNVYSCVYPESFEFTFLRRNFIQFEDAYSSLLNSPPTKVPIRPTLRSLKPPSLTEIEENRAKKDTRLVAKLGDVDSLFTAEDNLNHNQRMEAEASTKANPALAHIKDTYGDDDVLSDSVDDLIVDDGDSFFGEVDDSLSIQFISPGCTKEGVCSKGADKMKTSASSSKTKRRHMFSRCGCRAMIFLKYNKSHFYEVKSLVEHHNHKLAGTVGKHFLKVNRSMIVTQQSFAFNAAKVKIGPMKSFGLMKELLGGYDKVGATAVDFKNKDLRSIIGNADIQILMNKFKLLWADSIRCRNYDVFGDVISVDATFYTNKYAMVFVPFCGVDNHRKCVTFAATLLSKEDFDSYKLFFLAFVKAMVGVLLCMDDGFVSSLKPFVWGENLDASEFVAGWKFVLEAYDLTDNHWLAEMYECRHLWIPAYFRDDLLLGILRTTSWSYSSNSFFSNYHQSGDTLTQFYLHFETAMNKQRHVNSELNHKSDVAFPSTDIELILEKEAAESGFEVKKLVVYDPKYVKNFEVVHTLESNKVECFCELLERIGLSCTHLILALKQVLMQKIPRHLLLNRWMKNAEKNASRVFITKYDDKETFDMIVNDIWFDFNSCNGLAGDDKEALDFVNIDIKDIKHNLRDWKFKGNQINLTKKSVVEKLIGTEIPDRIIVQPPNEFRNKEN